jgi:hypothetical protein
LIKDNTAVQFFTGAQVRRLLQLLKGGAGCFNFNKIRDLAHKTENVLDLIRSRRTVPTAEVVNVLLLAFDKLHDMISNPAESEGADITEFASALEQLATSDLPQESKQSLTRQVRFSISGRVGRVPATEFDVDAARKSGKSIYLAEYDLLHDVQRRGKNPLEVLRKLMQYGSLLDTAFDLESAGTLEDEPSNGLVLLVLYATCVDTDLIGTVVDIPESRIWRVCRDGACQALGELPGCQECEATPEEELQPAVVHAKSCRTDERQLGATGGGGARWETAVAGTVYIAPGGSHLKIVAGAEREIVMRIRTTLRKTIAGRRWITCSARRRSLFPAWRWP